MAAYERYCAAERGRSAPLPEQVAKVTLTAAGREEVERQRRKAARRAARQIQKARAAAALATPQALETHARKKAGKALRKAAANGVTGAPAMERAFAKYQANGGRLARAAFERQMVAAS
jgi:hypothetical protein